MALWRSSRLEEVADIGAPPDQAWALVELGHFDAASERLEGHLDEPEWIAIYARLMAARGDFLGALAVLPDDAPWAQAERARILGRLGQFEAAHDALAGADGAAAHQVQAWLHLEAGEPAPASLLLPAEEPGASGTNPADEARQMLASCELERLRGELGLQTGKPAEAVARFGRSRALATRAGSPTEEAVSSARLGEAHAASGNRWRALRAVTRGLDLAATGRVQRGDLPGIHYRTVAVYRRYGHATLAESTLSSGHHLVLQLASGIDQRAYRESFLLDNRDCQRLVGAWKGMASWGEEVPRA